MQDYGVGFCLVATRLTFVPCVPTVVATTAEHFRRGPGSYELGTDFDFSKVKPLKGSGFGLEKSRDLLRAMIVAGHGMCPAYTLPSRKCTKMAHALIATRVVYVVVLVPADSMGPGMYDPPSDVFKSRTMNTRYMPMPAKTATRSSSSASSSTTVLGDVPMSKDQLWRSMRRGPAIDVPGSPPQATVPEKTQLIQQDPPPSTDPQAHDDPSTPPSPEHEKKEFFQK